MRTPFYTDPFVKKIMDSVEKRSLPGLRSHLKMAALPKRIQETPPSHAHQAAVILLFHRDENDLIRLIFIKRKSKNPNDPHSGQYAFPGGRYDETDGDFIQTAIRETQEEIGVSLTRENILFPISPIYIPVSLNVVKPYIAFINKEIRFTPSIDEVEYILPILLEKIIDTGNISRRKINTSYASDFEVPGYDIDGRWIWGATAMILQEFIDLWLERD